MAKKRKYLYIKLDDDRFVKARITLKGAEEPDVPTGAKLGKDIFIFKTTVKKPKPGYKVISVDDLPLDLKEALLK